MIEDQGYYESCREDEATQRAGADDFDVDAICLFLRSAKTYAMAIGDDDVGRSDANNLSGALGLIAALQARIAELEARNRVLEADNAILQNNLEAMESCDKELRAYIEEVEARNAASERDAGRYRWLRDCDGDQEDLVMIRNNFTPDEMRSGDDLDNAIDAAMEAANAS